MKIFVTGAGGFIGGSIAARLVRDGHQVSGLIRRPEQADELKALGIEPVIGSLDDRELLIAQAKAADGVINAASSDHRGAVEALIEGLDWTRVRALDLARPLAYMTLAMFPLSVLDLAGSRMRASDVLDLLQLEPVRDHFDIAAPFHRI